MNQLAIYGWNDKLDQLKQESTYNALPHGRISVVHRTCYEVVSENGQSQCELTGSMMYGRSDFELPCTEKSFTKLVEEVQKRKSDF